NPLRHPQAAKARRDWVLAGMAETGAITAEQAKAAVAGAPAVGRGQAEGGAPRYFPGEAGRGLRARLARQAGYGGGLTVPARDTRTYQDSADKAFRNGLIAYDRRHGWRGPVTHLPNAAAAQGALATMADPPGTGGWQLAAVTAVESGAAHIALKKGGQ